MILRRRKAKRTTIPKVLNHDSAKKLLEAYDWTPTGGGKHSTKMEKPGRRPITLPRHHGRDYSADLRKAILRQAGLDRGE
jgi:predicted RNA binding protein YcfA (HicA-like mRNA interferase family)